MSCFVAFHYRSYGTFFLHKNKLHNIHRGFTHYKYYRAIYPFCFLEVEEKSIELSYEYVDDGYSGSNFERPNFKNMIDDLNKGKFSIIMVKDLSRFGRDYIESGKYLQKIFPEKGIRFISVNDNYDSDNADVSDIHLRFV
ncbi:site-specific recombinase [Streptococcus pneumoniae]|nr:site-specific recombinase [Streptococcus pneumoniae]VSH13984.1 site-specific recombinase [Streptococcus pneumoniae]